MKFNLRRLLTPVLIGAIAMSCEKKELDEIATTTNLTSSNTSLATISDFLFAENFEDDSKAPWTGVANRQYKVNQPHSFNVVDNPYGSGKVGRFELRDTDKPQSNGTRTEVEFDIPEDTDRWYAFSIYLPSEYWQEDSKQDIIAQWHQGPTNPPMSLRVINGRMFMDIRTDAGNSNKVGVEGWNPMPKDQWLDIVMHIDFNHKSGITDIWVNGKKAMEYRGGNCFDEKDLDSDTKELLPRWKLGIYKSDWNGSKTSDTKKRVMYIDNVKMGDKNTTLAEIMPKSGNTSIITEPELPIKDSTTPNSTSASLLINTGGGQLVDSQSRTWAADQNYSSGETSSRPIDVASTSDDALYSNYRYASNGAPLNYSVPVNAAGLYTVKLHFVEPYFKDSNKRIFNVDVEGKRVISNYDLYSAEGYGKAVVKTFSNVSVTDGKLNIDLTSVKNNAIISAIEVIASSATTLTTTSSTSTVKLTNAGGEQFVDAQSRVWSADGSFSSGEIASRPIEVDGTTNNALYNNYRYASNGAPLNYSVPVNADGLYTVKLHFVEPYFKDSNKRIFNVDVEGNRVISNYDLYEEEGYGKAVIKTFSNVSVNDGRLDIEFLSVKDNAIISAIEVIKS